MNDFERIVAHYTFRKGRGDLLLIENEDGSTKILPRRDITFTFGNKGINAENVADAISNGLAVRVNGADFEAWYLGWDDEKKCKVLNGYGLRTANYLDGLKASTSFMHFVSDWDEPVYIESEPVVVPWLGANNARIGSIADGTWCFEYSVQTAIDDYTINKYFFEQKPSLEDAILVDSVENLAMQFFTGELAETFTCWECGRETHWLDLEGNWKQKMELATERYCGC